MLPLRVGWLAVGPEQVGWNSSAGSVRAIGEPSPAARPSLVAATASAILAGMAIQPRSFRPLAFALVAATAIFGSAWWLRWPHQTVERFVGHLGSGQFELAAAMVAEPSALRAEGGQLVVRTADGREVAVPRRGATLAALAAPGRPARAGLSSYLLAEQRFAFAIRSEAPAGGEAVHEVLCCARRGCVELTTIR